MEDIYWMTKENCIKTNEEIMREIISYKKFIQEHRNVEKNFLKNWFPILTDSENLIDVENASLKINKLEDFN